MRLLEIDMADYSETNSWILRKFASSKDRTRLVLRIASQ
jgi:hypothetical protein